MIQRIATMSLIATFLLTLGCDTEEPPMAYEEMTCTEAAADLIRLGMEPMVADPGDMICRCAGDSDPCGSAKDEDSCKKLDCSMGEESGECEWHGTGDEDEGTCECPYPRLVTICDFSNGSEKECEAETCNTGSGERDCEWKEGPG